MKHKMRNKIIFQIVSSVCDINGYKKNNQKGMCEHFMNEFRDER